MTTPAYYKNGVPMDASGMPIITITGGPSSPVLNTGTNPQAPTPIFVNWPGVGGPHGGGGQSWVADYNPKKLPFTGLYYLREGLEKVNKFLERARQAYPENAEQVRNEAGALLANLKDTGLINNSEIKAVADALQDAVDSLLTNINLKNQAEKSVINASQESNTAFLDFMNKERLSNFIDKSPDIIDFTIMGTPGGGYKIWEKTVTPKFSAEIEKKNELITFLDRVNTITADVDRKKNELAKVKNSVEVKEKEKKEAAEKENDAKEALIKSSELISDMGEKIGAHLGDKYKAVVKEIADDIKNFQGKTIRSHADAMASLNKILANPGMKINKGDKDALVNAWKIFNAEDTANKLGNLGRAFKVADVAIKVEKVRINSIIGYETGDWNPLMLEVESWVLSGIAVGVAMSILTAAASTIAATVGLPVTAIIIIGLMVISYVASFIDSSVAEKINNEVIRPAY